MLSSGVLTECPIGSVSASSIFRIAIAWLNPLSADFRHHWMALVEEDSCPIPSANANPSQY